MKTKLTLRLDDDLIVAAKREAASRRTSLSRMVADYFQGIRARNRPAGAPNLGPVTSQLIGIAKGSKADEKDYREHLIRKHS